MAKPKPTKEKESQVEKESEEDFSMLDEEQKGILPDDVDFRRCMGCGG
jgi:hypothetical protein